MALSGILIRVTFHAVRGYSAGSAMRTPEPGEMIRELLARKQALQMELRQRAATSTSMYYGSRLAISLMTNRRAARIAFAAGPGLLVTRNASRSLFFNWTIHQIMKWYLGLLRHSIRRGCFRRWDIGHASHSTTRKTRNRALSYQERSCGYFRESIRWTAQYGPVAGILLLP